jgi:hypothetical protein
MKWEGGGVSDVAPPSVCLGGEVQVWGEEGGLGVTEDAGKMGAMNRVVRISI